MPEVAAQSEEAWAAAAAAAAGVVGVVGGRDIKVHSVGLLCSLEHLYSVQSVDGFESHLRQLNELCCCLDL